jgi:hypothetical protein
MKILPARNEERVSDYCACVTFQEQNNSPGNPFAGADSGRRPTTGQSRLIIALPVVLIVVVATVGAWLIWGRGEDDDSATGPASASTSAVQDTGSEERPGTDSVALLENAGVQSVNPAPVPEAVEAWGDYVKNRSWNGMLRVFEGQDATPVTDEDHSRFPASMNNCGIAMYLVTFRSVNEDVLLDAQLRNAANNIDASLTLSDGWILTTNCDTPQFRFNSSTDISNLGDVAYEVTEYRQSSVAAPAVESAEEPAASAAEPAVSVGEPYVVECLQGAPGPAQWSDGTMRYAEECTNTPEAQRSIRAEGLCGGLYAPEDVSREEFESICNRAPVYPPEAVS